MKTASKWSSDRPIEHQAGPTHSVRAAVPLLLAVRASGTRLLWPAPVVALNRAVAVGFAAGPAAGLAALDALAGEPQLAGYSYLPAARADFLRRLGRLDEARIGYEEALLLTENTVEQQFLARRLTQLG